MPMFPAPRTPTRLNSTLRSLPPHDVPAPLPPQRGPGGGGFARGAAPGAGGRPVPEPICLDGVCKPLDVAQALGDPLRGLRPIRALEASPWSGRAWVRGAWRRRLRLGLRRFVRVVLEARQVVRGEG